MKIKLGSSSCHFNIFCSYPFLVYSFIILTLKLQICESVAEVRMTTCGGSCGNSFEDSAIFWSGEENGIPAVQNKECKCCKGKTGEWKTHDVSWKRVLGNGCVVGIVVGS